MKNNEINNNFRFSLNFLLNTKQFILSELRSPTSSYPKEKLYNQLHLNSLCINSLYKSKLKLKREYYE